MTTRTRTRIVSTDPEQGGTQVRGSLLLSVLADLVRNDYRARLEFAAFLALAWVAADALGVLLDVAGCPAAVTLVFYVASGVLMFASIVTGLSSRGM